MKKLFFSLLFCSPLLLHSQNLPQCDSLIIDCCTLGNDTVSLNASNTTTVLFDYPGFVLFDSNWDTIAKENVTYFGISAGPQPHYMVVMAPLILPFAGYLNLYYNFYDSLGCSFPITIADTASAIRDLQNDFRVAVYPNPSNGNFVLETNAPVNQLMEIYNVVGEKIFEIALSDRRTSIQLNAASGIYFYRTANVNQQTARGKIVVK